MKSISSARGFVNNGSPPQPAPAWNDEDDGEPAQNKTIYDALAPLAEHWRRRESR